MSPRALLAILAAMFLLGCSTTASYQRTRDTGQIDMAECQKAAPDSVWLAIGIPLVDAVLFGAIWGPLYAADSVMKGQAYADCKTDLESRGYTRIAPADSR